MGIFVICNCSVNIKFMAKVHFKVNKNLKPLCFTLRNCVYNRIRWPIGLISTRIIKTGFSSFFEFVVMLNDETFTNKIKSTIV